MCQRFQIHHYGRFESPPPDELSPDERERIYGPIGLGSRAPSLSLRGFAAPAHAPGVGSAAPPPPPVSFSGRAGPGGGWAWGRAGAGPGAVRRAGPGPGAGCPSKVSGGVPSPGPLLSHPFYQ